MPSLEWGSLLVGLAAALLVGTLLEYTVHRLMHAGKFLKRVHAKHHAAGTGQGWFGEFRDYFLPSLPIVWVGFPFSVSTGIGFASGVVLYAFFAAYAHQVQHENPELVFWMRKPVHHIHHRDKMWNHNFGISTSLWDHVFRTYKSVEWQPGKRPWQYGLAAFFRIRWF